MERTYDDGIKLGMTSKKRFIEAKTGVVDASRLKLIVCKSHRDQSHNNKLVEQILRKQTQQLLLSPDAILIRRFSSGRIVFWNPGAHKLYGWSKKDAMGKIVYDLLETELPDAPRDIKAQLRRHGYWSGELVQTRKNGRKIIVASHWSLRQSLNGGPMEILEVNYNLSDKRQSGEKARESERLVLLGTMAAVFAHEVANPLTGLSASLQFVQSELDTKKLGDTFLRDTVRAARQEIDRLGSLLDEFRSLALPQTLDLRLTDLATIIREVLAIQKMAYRAGGITVKLEFENGLPAIELDAAKMKQVILNLCKNAIEAMQNGGSLTIKAYRTGQSVLLEIRDDGIGVPKGVNIFELFKTTKPSGSGLGLPLVQQIVAAHNGTINYTSDAGRGTTFTIRLPAATQMV
jgi:PAS domain S-box-containing protein